jgi:acyl-[acyl-carrier-protein]-phospholipid O-acyltransferase / long-chain-fatty-acid--[acyl-carrier-protein] ligase
VTASNSSSPVITQRLIAQLKSSRQSFKCADSSGVKLTGQQLLMRTLALRSYLLREVLEEGEENVGIFLPPTVPAVATNFAVSLCNRVSVNLNYTVKGPALDACSETAGLKRILTSRRFMEKLDIKLKTPLVYLEDIKERISWSDKLAALLNTKLRSAAGLHRGLGLGQRQPDDPVTIIFTSGSTGVPKGVVLTYGNIANNVDGIDTAIKLNERDVVLGILPLFHSFGYTVTMWAAMTLPSAVVYHFSPLDARQIGKLAGDYRATVLLATPTFLRSYIRRVEPEQFQHLQVVVLGAEKMPIALADDFQQRFGVRPVEGYGTTELSPLVSVNIPPSRASDSSSSGLREGTVGKPIANVEARTVSLDDDTPLPKGEVGLLEIRGPNVMQGYYKRPELTQEVMHDDWYRTGDVAIVHPDGFIEITGRLSRFSKIGGEMVPHILIEDTIAEILGPSEEGTLQVAITAVPDEKKGERLIVLHTLPEINKRQILSQLAERHLPPLFLPGEDSFYQVDQIPVLGTGKLDLKGLKETALRLAQGGPAA